MIIRNDIDVFSFYQQSMSRDSVQEKGHAL